MSLKHLSGTIHSEFQIEMPKIEGSPLPLMLLPLGLGAGILLGLEVLMGLLSSSHLLFLCP